MADVYPFNYEAEVLPVEYRKALPGIYGMPGMPARKFHTPITPRENFLRVANHQKPVWLPNMNLDFNVVQPEIMADAYARNHGGVDWFGIDWTYEPLSAAAMVTPGTRRLSDIKNWEKELVWPDLDSIDWAQDYEKTYASGMDPDRPTLFVIVNGFFERLADLTSFEDAFMYLLEEQEALEAFYTKLCDFHIKLGKIAREYYHADLITFHDDMGSQKNAFMSPDTFNEVLKPHYQRMNQAFHEMGMYVNFHSCGNVGVQVPNFADCGFDFWEGQDNCNDKQALMDQYGDKLGQVSVFMPPPDLSDEEFEQTMKNLVTGLGAKGRYITWYGDMNPERAKKGEELIYSFSREFYSK